MLIAETVAAAISSVFRGPVKVAHFYPLIVQLPLDIQWYGLTCQVDHRYIGKIHALFQQRFHYRGDRVDQDLFI